MTKDRLAGGVPTHAAVNQALTSGFSGAFELAGLIALAGFIAAALAVRHAKTLEAIPSQDAA